MPTCSTSSRARWPSTRGEEEDLDTIGVKAVDDYTVEFTLKQPAGYFPGIASMWVARPVYAPVIDEYGARWVEPGIIVSNGPYLMESWKHFDSMTFVKNPEFYDADTVQIERIEAVMIVEASTAFAMYENNELDTGGVAAGRDGPRQGRPGAQRRAATSESGPVHLLLWFHQQQAAL